MRTSLSWSCKFTAKNVYTNLFICFDFMLNTSYVQKSQSSMGLMYIVAMTAIYNIFCNLHMNKQGINVIFLKQPNFLLDKEQKFAFLRIKHQVESVVTISCCCHKTPNNIFSKSSLKKKVKTKSKKNMNKKLVHF